MQRDLGHPLQLMKVCRKETSVLWVTLLSSIQAHSHRSPIPSNCDFLVYFPDPRSYLSASQPPKSTFPVKSSPVPQGIFPKIPKNKLNFSWAANEMKMTVAIFVDKKWSNIYHFIWLSLIDSRQHHLQCATLVAPISHTSKSPRSLTIAHQDLQGSTGLPWHCFGQALLIPFLYVPEICSLRLTETFPERNFEVPSDLDINLYVAGWSY